VIRHSIFATITYHKWSVIDYSMTIVDWLATGVVLVLLPSYVGLVKDKKGGIELATFSAQ
jgi:hypothetical protein